MTYRNAKLLAHADGAPCMMCSIQDGTVVAAHSNLQRHGRGKDFKSDDCFVAFLCWKCHLWLDYGLASYELKLEAFQRAKDKTLLWLFENGKIVVA